MKHNQAENQIWLTLMKT